MISMNCDSIDARLENATWFSPNKWAWVLLAFGCCVLLPGLLLGTSVCAAAGAIVCVAVIALRLPIWKTGIFWICLAWALWQLLSQMIVVGWGVPKIEGTMYNWLAFFGCAYFFRDEKFRRWALYAISGIMLMVAIIVALQLFIGYDANNKPFRIGRVKVGWYSTGLQSHHLPFGFLVGTLFLFFIPEVRISRAVKFLVLVISLFCLSGSTARGAMVGMVSGFILLLLFNWRVWSGSLKIFGLALPIILIVTLAFFRPSAVSLENLSTGNGRIEIWKASIEMIKDRPFFGAGGEQAYKNMIQLYSINDAPLASHLHAHNNYLQFAAASGIPALLLYVLMICFFGNYLWRNRGIDRNGASMMLAILSMMIVAGFFEYNAGFTSNSLMFWALLGFAVARIESERLKCITGINDRTEGALSNLG